MKQGLKGVQDDGWDMGSYSGGGGGGGMKEQLWQKGKECGGKVES